MRPSVDFMYLFMGKLGKWLSLISVRTAVWFYFFLAKRCQRLQLWSLHTIW